MTGAAFGPGFHGKVPARGDFVVHGLPAAFLDPWDAWMQAALLESRAAIGGAWDRLFAACPAWRFVLAPGLCGDVAVAGVLVPSVDRVGRLYPFVLAAGLPGGVDAAVVPFACAPWFGRAEAIARDASTTGTPFETTLSAVKALEPPDPGFGALNPAHRTRLEEMVGRLPPKPTLWWTRGAHWVTPSFLAHRGLPAGERFAALMDNGWDRWGWKDVAEG